MAPTVNTLRDTLDYRTFRMNFMSDGPLGAGGIKPITLASLASNPLYNGDAISLGGGSMNGSSLFPKIDIKAMIGERFRLMYRTSTPKVEPVEEKKEDPGETNVGDGDLSEKTDKTNIFKDPKTKNTVLLGTLALANGLTLAGAVTGNTKLSGAGEMMGALGDVGNTLKNWKSLEGLEGLEKTDAKLSNMSNVANAAGNMADASRKMFFSNVHDNDSSLTSGINTTYDSVASAMMGFSPVGTIVGGAMKVGAFAGDAIKAAGGGTDLMTKTDLWMDSNLLSWNIGALNGFAGKKTNSFGVNLDIVAAVGGDYGGSVTDLYSAEKVAGKKYGLFSSKSRRSANRNIARARNILNKMTGIANEANDMRTGAESTSQFNYLRYLLNLNGGILDYALSAKLGGSLALHINIETRQIEDDWVPEITNTINEFKLGGVIEEPEWLPSIEIFKSGGTIEEEWTPDIELFKDGGEITDDSYQKFLDTLPNNLKNTGNEYQMRRYWELNGKPKNFTEAINREEPMFLYDKKDKKYHAHTIAWNENGEGEFMKAPGHPTIGEELKFYYGDSEESKKFREEYTLDMTGPYWKYIKKVQLHKDGGTVGEDVEPLTTLKNVIPDGALHKNKHHMENADGLTKKGIPVIDNNGEQLAEIELNEIIFSLEVTKKLEDLYKNYNHYDTTSKEKDEFAIEAGKLLVLEILFNTEDNTNLIDSLKLGGKING